MPSSKTKCKQGTELNLPCHRLNITRVMSIIQKISDEHLADLKETGNPMDPYGVDEITARKWPLPKDFFDALLDPRWREWVKAIRREMRGFEENSVFYRIPRSEMKPGKFPIKSLEIFSHKYKHGKL